MLQTSRAGRQLGRALFRPSAHRSSPRFHKFRSQNEDSGHTFTPSEYPTISERTVIPSESPASSDRSVIPSESPAISSIRPSTSSISESWLYEEILNGSYWDKAAATFPAVPWDVKEIVKVLGGGLVVAAAAVVLTAQSGLVGDLTAAEQHLVSEAVMVLTVPLLLRIALGGQSLACFNGSWNGFLVLQTFMLCGIVFPLVDPLLFSGWSSLLQPVFGAPPSSSFVESLQQAADAGDTTSVLEQWTASAVFAPVWEEVLWRGFFLASLAKVLPYPGAVAMSAFNFACMHLSPFNFAPLMILSACCDMLYIRTANLLLPMLFHSAWNTYQILAIAYLHKPDFV